MSQSRASRRVAGARRPVAAHESVGTQREPSCADADADEAPQESPDNVMVLLTAEQAAQRLQLRVSWLRRKAAARAIPCRYVGKHLRFTHDDLLAIADQSKSDPRTPRTGRGRVP